MQKQERSLSLFILISLLSVSIQASNLPVVQQPDSLKNSSSHVQIRHQLDRNKLALRSKSALIEDSSGNILFDRTPDTPMPIASITKLMTAMVILDAKQPMDEMITVTKADRDLIRLTGSTWGRPEPSWCTRDPAVHGS